MTKGKASVGKAKDEMELDEVAKPSMKREESKISAADDEMPDEAPKLNRKMSIVNEEDDQIKE